MFCINQTTHRMTVIEAMPKTWYTRLDDKRRMLASKLVRTVIIGKHQYETLHIPFFEWDTIVKKIIINKNGKEKNNSLTFLPVSLVSSLSKKKNEGGGGRNYFRR